MVSKFFEEFKVEGRLLKLLFADLKLIFKNTTYSKTIKFTIIDNYLKAEVLTSNYYVAMIPIESPIKIKSTLSCLYKDIYDIIPAREKVTLSFVATYLGITTSEANATLSKSLYEVASIDTYSDNRVTIETRDILPGIRWLLSLTAYTTAYPGNNKIVFNGDYMQISYSTLRVECKSSKLVDVMDFDTATILKSMLEGSESFEVSETIKGITFHIGNRILHINKAIPRGIKTVDEITKNYRFIGDVNYTDLTLKANKLYGIVNKCDVYVTVFENRIDLYYSGTDGSDSTINIIVGNKVVNDTMLDRFRIRLEFLKSILTILGDSFEYYREGNKLCLKGTAIKIVSTTLS